jgi:hypothetical protein
VIGVSAPFCMRPTPVDVDVRIGRIARRPKRHHHRRGRLAVCGVNRPGLFGSNDTDRVHPLLKNLKRSSNSWVVVLDVTSDGLSNPRGFPPRWRLCVTSRAKNAGGNEAASREGHRPRHLADM